MKNFPGKKTRKQKYIYVIASTLNQMVNYIPLKMNFEKIALIKPVYNITLIKGYKSGKKSKVEENHEWDSYFKDTSKVAMIDIDIEKGDWLNTKKVVKKFEEVFQNKKEPIFWNITGGQRPFVMAVLAFIQNRPNDVIAYLEGNSYQLSLNHGIVDQRSYKVDGLTIVEAFQLMGYDLKGIDTAVTLNNIRKYINLWKLYKTDKNLRKAFIISNTKTGNIEDVKNLISDISLHFILDRHNNKEYPFGYILEDLVVAVLKVNFEQDIAEIKHSVKLKFKNEILNINVGNKILDEFDILLLNKAGQLLNFECKSGGMSGDVAKSTKYSTYAISGVYGKPILITPLTKDEIKYYTNLSDEYKYVKSAIRSAKRAKLEVWGIDEIDKKVIV